MESAYQLKALVDKLKARGLDVAEDAAKIMVEETFNWVGESAAMSENKVDDLVALGLPKLQEIVMPFIDKIDGKVDLV